MVMRPPGRRPARLGAPTNKEILDSKEIAIVSDPEWSRKLELTKKFYLTDPRHGGNLKILSEYQGFDQDIIRRAIYDGIGAGAPWEYAKYEQVVTLKKEMKKTVDEFNKFVEEMNLPDLKNVVRLATDVMKRGLSQLHGSVETLSPKEIQQVSAVAETCYKMIRLVEEKPTEIVMNRSEMSADAIREGMLAMAEADKDVIDWEIIEPDSKPDKVN